jgi:hypothetical protein
MDRADSWALALLRPNHPESDRLLVSAAIRIGNGRIIVAVNTLLRVPEIPDGRSTGGNAA